MRKKKSEVYVCKQIFYLDSALHLSIFAFVSFVNLYKERDKQASLVESCQKAARDIYIGNERKRQYKPPVIDR